MWNNQEKNKKDFQFHHIALKRVIHFDRLESVIMSM